MTVVYCQYDVGSRFRVHQHFDALAGELFQQVTGTKMTACHTKFQRVTGLTDVSSEQSRCHLHRQPMRRSYP